MRITTDDGVELAVEVQGSGPPLVLVHGFGGAKEDFADHLDALARTHLVATFDHRGHGASDKPDSLEAYSLARLEADVIAVADALDMPTFRLLGHSMGGMVVRGVVIRHAARIDALVLMDTVPGPIEGFDAEIIDIACDHAMTQGKDALKELLDFAAALDTPAHERLISQRPGYQEFCDRKWADVSVTMWSAMAAAMARQPDDLPALAGVQCPTLVIVGEQDKPFRRASRRMAETIAGAQLAIIPNAGHSPQFENPEVWISTLSGFLAALPAPTAAG